MPEPDDKQREAIAHATERVQERAARVATRVELKERALNVTPPHTDTCGWGNHIKDTFGTSSSDFAALEMDRLASALVCTTKAGTARAQTVTNAALAAVAAAQPKDEIEAMLASQMAATHALVMDLMGRTKRAEYQPQFEMAGNMAVKLLRTFTAQTEALARLRRGGEQTVRVEHVHVHPGGQAVVGTVTAGVGGGKEDGGRPHALGTLAYVPSTPMRSPHANRDAVPVANNEQGAMPVTPSRPGP